MSASADPQVQRAEMRVGQTLRGKWRLDRLIGIGGMAAVYAGTHRNGMRGAVKVLHLELGGLGDVKDRFLREGYAANKVDHAGVVRILDDDVAEDGSVFLVMELLDGQTVEALAEPRPGHRLELGEVLSIADMLLDVLAAAHEKGIVHRDLKPENLFMTRKGELKVLDFGIARLREVQGSSRATTAGTAMGTPAFMPPEQASGRWDVVDQRTDIWAVGATMFALLTGRVVHEAPTLQLLLGAAMMKPAPPLATVAPNLSPGVCAIVDRALAFEQDQRWPNAHAMQHGIRELRSGRPLGTTPPSAQTIVAAASIADPLSVSVTGQTAWRGSSPHASLSSPVHVTTSPVSTNTHRSARTRGGVIAAIGIGGLALALVAWLSLRGGPTAPAGSTAPSAGPELPAAAATPAAPSITVSPTGEPSPVVSAAPSAEPAASAEASSTPTATAGPLRPRPNPKQGPKPPGTAGPRKHEGLF